MTTSNQAGSKPTDNLHYATGRDRKLIIARLREIDRMSAKELKALRHEADRLSARSQRKQPPKTT